MFFWVLDYCRLYMGFLIFWSLLREVENFVVYIYLIFLFEEFSNSNKVFGKSKIFLEGWLYIYILVLIMG